MVRRRDEARHRQSRSAGNATLQGSGRATGTPTAAGNRQLSSKVKKAQRIFQLAQEGADAYHMFKLRRAGAGTVFVNDVVNHLKFLVAQEPGADSVDQFLSVASRQAARHPRALIADAEPEGRGRPETSDRTEAP